MKPTLFLLILFPGIIAGPVFATDSVKKESGTQAATTSKDETPAAVLSPYTLEAFGPVPSYPSGPLAGKTLVAIDTAFGENLLLRQWGPAQTAALQVLAKSEDPRVAWLISDMMRVAGPQGLMAILAVSITELLGLTFEQGDYWKYTTNHLIAWDLPAPPDYLKYKRNIYRVVEPRWERIFVEGDIDWRHVSWGGVPIDDREYDKTDASCNCIPAADNPTVTKASEAQWLDDDDIIFGIEINGEYRAYPRRIMEVREMVNDTLGGRHIGIPYCTLCGSAQAYLTDEMPEGTQRPILRTTGLLIRSNKVMYDVNTYSVFDTFLGKAVTGPLAEKDISLNQVSMITTEWGRWKAAYPQTTVLAESLALGRDFDFRNNRDANGPIFPIGDVDPRLPIQEDVIGLLTSSGQAIAFPVDKVLEALQKGDSVEYENIQIILDAGGIKAVNRAVNSDGKDLGSHQSFWFAWSQFHPDTKLWQL